MKELPMSTASPDLCNAVIFLPYRLMDMHIKMIMSSAELVKATQTYANGLHSYYFNFMAPYSHRPISLYLIKFHLSREN